jgi:sugar phosphate isomerase/epimerase
MRIGCCASIDNYKAVCDAGYDYIELPGAKISAMTEDEFSAAKKTVLEGPIDCNGFNASIPPHVKITGPEFDPKVAREYAELVCSRAQALGAKYVGIGSPMSRRLPEGYDYNKAIDQAMEFLTIIAEVAQKYNITILWEALTRILCNFVNYQKEALEMVKKLNLPNVKLVVDFFQMETNGDEDVTDIAEEMKYTEHLHVSDYVDGKRTFLLPEKREFHKKCLAAAKAGGYDITVSVEPDVGVGTVEVEGKQTAELLKSILAEI